MNILLPSLTCFICTICLTLRRATALTFSRHYPHSNIPLQPNATLSYHLDFPTQTIILALRISDPSHIHSSTSPSWLGLGIAEPTSGGMKGADIVTAQFRNHTTCTLVDRHVPHVPYPFADSPNSIYPFPDQCQTDGSWLLINCETDPHNGHMLLEVSRTLSAHDTQDRRIASGPQAIIHAYGAGFGYHSARRGSTRVELFREDGTVVPVHNQNPVPSDVNHEQQLLAEYQVPPRETSYICTSFKLQTGPRKGRMIVAAEPVLRSNTRSLAHHMILYICMKSAFTEYFAGGNECYGGEAEPPGGFPAWACRGLAVTWALGVGRFVYPEDVGMLVEEDDSYLILQTHYDNPSLEEGNVDNSGIKLYLTDRPRSMMAGSMVLGDGFVARRGELLKNGFEYAFTCPAECTERMPEKINIFASFQHMHTTGKEIYTNKFGADGEYVENVNKVNFWDNNFQNMAFLNPPRTLSPGESLSTTCVYDTSKRPNTRFGFEVADEMCMDILFYYPLQTLTTSQQLWACHYYGNDQISNITICGDNNSFDQSSFLPIGNPSFQDTTGASTSFGQGPDGCSDITNTTSGSDGTLTTLDTNSETDDTAGDHSCFPSTATVLLEDGSRKPMSGIRIGDNVLTGMGTFSPIFMFTHADASARRHSFIRLHTSSGHAVTLTAGHYIYANERLVPAGRVRKGDVVLLEGGVGRVTGVDVVERVGLYNPQTVAGDIFVDGVLASTYTTAVEPELAHALLTPLRAAFRAMGVGVSV